MEDKNWIKGAIKHPGAFTAQAKRAKEGTQEFASDVLSNKDKYNETTVRRAALAKRLAAMNKG